MAVVVERLVTGPFQENTFLVADEASGDAVVVDPGIFDDREMAALEALVEARGLTVRAVVNTHGHIDHIAGVGRVQARFSVPFYVHPGERTWLSAVPQQCAMFGFPPIEEPEVTHWLEDGQQLQLGTLQLEVRHLPGHTEGGCALLVPGHALVGDTLFAGSIGRTDFPGGSLPALERSIREGLYTLPDDTVVHTGHGPDTTIGEERRTNPFVRG